MFKVNLWISFAEVHASIKLPLCRDKKKGKNQSNQQLHRWNAFLSLHGQIHLFWITVPCFISYHGDKDCGNVKQGSPVSDGDFSFQPLSHCLIDIFAEHKTFLLFFLIFLIYIPFFFLCFSDGTLKALHMQFYVGIRSRRMEMSLRGNRTERTEWCSVHRCSHVTQ